MIVSDATALITLINIDEFELLKLFASEIIIPSEVYNEIVQYPSASKYLTKEIEGEFIRVVAYEDKQLFHQIYYLLDAGESAAITLAIEHNLPLIIDEKKGRRFAQRQGVEIIGLIGIIRFLYGDKVLSKERVLEIVDKLNRSDFRVSSKLLELVLQ
jgi:predicted nucleic acid-binding protein